MLNLKVILFVIGIAGGVAGAYWVYGMIQENAKLNVELDSALEANAAVVADNNYLLNEIRTRDADLVARENYINELSATTAGIREELADAKTKLSAEELVCLDADIPVPYYDRLLQRSSKDGDQDGESMPVISLSAGVQLSCVPWPELGRCLRL